MIAYKFLRADGSTVFSGFRWPLPGDEPGAWVQAAVDPCRSGIHACRPGDLPYWVGPTLYEIELGGEIVEERTKVIAARGRLLRRVTAWDDGTPRRVHAHVRRPRARDRPRRAGARRRGTPASNSSIPDGPAMLGFMAAAIAEQRGGLAAYHAERERQAAWLAERLRP